MSVKIGDHISANYLDQYFMKGIVKSVTELFNKEHFITINLDSDITHPIFKQDREVILKPQEIINFN